MSNIGKLSVILSANAAKFNTVMGSAEHRVQRFADKTGALGMKLGKMGAVMAAPILLGIGAYAKLEFGMAKVSTMLDEQGMELIPQWTRSVQKLSAASGQAVGTLADALYNIKSAAVEDRYALDMLTTSTTAAVGGMTDVAVAADLATTMLNSYGLSAKRSGDIQDWAFAVVKRGKLNYQQLAGYIGMVAAPAKVAGLSIEELGALIATLTRGGIRARRAMTGAASALEAFTGASEEAQAIARTFGFEMSANTLKTIGFSGVIGKLREKAASIEELKEMFPSAQAFRAVAVALLGYEGMLTDLIQITDRAGASQEAYDKMVGTLTFKLGRLKASFFVLAQTIGAAVLPQVTALLKRTQAWLDISKEWLAHNGRAIVGWAKSAAYIVGVAVAIKGISIAAGLAVTAVHGLRIALSATAFMIANPIVVALLAVAGIIAKIYLDVKKISAVAERAGALGVDDRMSEKALKNRLANQLAREVELHKMIAKSKKKFLWGEEGAIARTFPVVDPLAMGIPQALGKAFAQLPKMLEMAAGEYGKMTALKEALSGLEEGIKKTEAALEKMAQATKAAAAADEVLLKTEGALKTAIKEATIEIQEGIDKRAKELEQAEKIKALQEAAGGVFVATRTPLEAYAIEMQKLQTMFAELFIDETTFERAAIAAREAMTDKLKNLPASIQLQEKENLAKQIYLQTRTAAEVFARELTTLKQLEAMDLIDIDTFERAARDAKRKFEMGFEREPGRGVGLGRGREVQDIITTGGLALMAKLDASAVKGVDNLQLEELKKIATSTKAIAEKRGLS